MKEIMPPKISIFMPVYNGEQYLQRTLDSISNQTFQDYEVVCVDDSSTDSSYEWIAKYAQRDSRIKLHRKPNGGNVPKSWIYALPYLTGDYILYCSQDDFFSPDLLECMYQRAISSHADATIPQLTHYYGEGQSIPVATGVDGDTARELTGREAFLLSLDWRIHAFVLWRSSLVKSIGFDDIATNSDEYATRCFFLHSKKVVFSQGMFYYNKENPQAITAHVSIKRWDWCITNTRLIKLMNQHDFSTHEKAWFAYKVWGNTLHQHRLYLAHRSAFNCKEKEKIEEILTHTYRAIDWKAIAQHFGIKGEVIRLLYSHSFWLNQRLLSFQRLIGK